MRYFANSLRGGILLQSSDKSWKNRSTLFREGGRGTTIRDSVEEMRKGGAKAFECRGCRPAENKTLRRTPRETSADDLWVETISAPCNIHHGEPLPREAGLFSVARPGRKKKKNNANEYRVGNVRLKVWWVTASCPWENGRKAHC